MSAVGVPEDPGVEWDGMVAHEPTHEHFWSRGTHEGVRYCLWCSIPKDDEPEPRPSRDWRERYHADWKTSREMHR